MIAVTGASGYIGRATVARLAQDGPVTAVSRSAPPQSVPQGVTWKATGDVAPSAETFEGCTAVIHLAGRAHTTVAFQDGRDLFDLSNRQLALATAAAAHAAGVRRFVFVSTVGVHGNWSEADLQPDSPLKLDSPYARSKWLAEQELAAACAASGMELCIVRPPMVYGPGCPGNFPRLLRMVGLGLPLPFGSIDAVRSFIHVDNLASFLAACATRPLPPDKIFVVGDGSDWSLIELLRVMAEGQGLRSRLFPFPVGLLRLAGRLAGRMREVDSLTRPMRIDADQARRALDWRPPLDPARALREAVQAHAA